MDVAVVVGDVVVGGPENDIVVDCGGEVYGEPYRC